MDDQTLRKVQLAQLDIAKELKRVCDNLGIDYFLDSGTLLGAVRHKGFIPWDDDLDIGMTRENYNLFLKKAPNELGKDYFLQTWETDKDYGMAFSKIRKNGTVYIEDAAQSSNSHKGIYIDIFPYDIYPEDEKKRKWQGRRYSYYRRLLMAKCHYKPWKMSKGGRIIRTFKHCMYYLLAIFALFYTKEKIINKYTNFCSKFNDEESTMLYAQAGASNYGKWLIPRQSITTYSLLEFEDDIFKVPGDYDSYLRSIYNDYMTLPPEDKRINRHKIIEVKF